MANPSIVQGDLVVYGALSASSIDQPAGSIKNSHFSATASDRLAASKAVHQFAVAAEQKNGTDAVSETRIVHIAKGAGTVVDFQAVADAVPASGDKAASIDLQKSTGGGAFATLLTTPIVLNSSDTNRTPNTGTLVGSPTYAAGDLLAVVVTVSGSTGSQAQGLCARAMVQENPS